MSTKLMIKIALRGKCLSSEVAWMAKAIYFMLPASAAMFIYLMLPITYEGLVIAQLIEASEHLRHQFRIAEIIAYSVAALLSIAMITCFHTSRKFSET